MGKTTEQGERKRIGDLLLEAGVVSEEQLRAALELKKEKGGRLCFNLIRLGALKADDLLVFLKEQFGVAAVNLDNFHIDGKVLGLVPADYARRVKVVPLHLMDETLTVAMVDPGRGEVLEELREMTGKEIDPLIAPESSLENALGKYYGEPAAASASEEGLLVVGGEKEEKHLYLSSPPPGGYTPEDWLKRFVLHAIKVRSREIHLEPGEWGVRARYRLEEKLVPGEAAPPEARKGIIDRALGLARVDASRSASSPLEGRMRVLIRKRTLRLALSSFPTLQGERIVLQLLDEGLLGKGFQELGMTKEVSDDLGRILRLRSGVLLLNAPPGHGKRTTFYSILQHLQEDGGRNVMTLEYPVQYRLGEIGQTQVAFGHGVDFYYGLRSLMRQRPDVVGLTDIADCRTLELVFSAARECLVVGLCSFWDNMQALEWISGCGISPSTQARFIRGLLAQRVLPRVCSHCRERLEEPVEIFEGVRDKKQEELQFYAGRGCGRCGQTGRTGRLGVFELLSLRFVLRDMLTRGTDPRILHDEAQRMGMWTLREDGVMKATQGLLDVRDVLEVTLEEREEE